MAKAFSIRDFMNDARQQDSESDVFEKVSIYDIGSNPKNEYTMSEIEKIKDSIYALGGVQQNVVLVKCPEGSQHKYLALDGHRRLTASRELVGEGYREFEYVPAVIKGQIDTDMENAVLIMMNSTQRNKTDWEKVMEHMRLKEIIPKLKKRQGIDGRTRDIEADMLGVSQCQIGIYNTVGTRLNAELMEMFKNGSIGISLAYEAAKQDTDIQEQLALIARCNGGISEGDIKRLLGHRNIKDQSRIPETVTENVSESDTPAEPAAAEGILDKPVGDMSQSKPDVCPVDNKEPPGKVSAAKNVSESDTSELGAGELPDINFRGGYTSALVGQQIERYTGYLDVIDKNNKPLQLISEYNCLLDALELLRNYLGWG